MTANQVAYHNALELERHNKMMEQETQRHQQAQELLTKWQNELTGLQISVNAMHYARMDAENERANRAREQQNVWNLQETQRSNVASEAIKNQANRIDAASVAETSRHQKEMERIQSSLNNSTISRNYADVSYIGANTDYVQARTKTESLQPSVINAEVALKTADTILAQERAKSETSNRFQNWTAGARNIGSTLKYAVDSLGSILELGGLNVRTTNSGSSQPDFWTFMEQQLN